MSFMKLSKSLGRYKSSSLIKPLIKLLRNQSGNVLIMVAFLTVILFGMTALVVDAGMLYREKSILQKTVDSATLAGVQFLDGKNSDEKDADDVANSYVISNYDGVKGKLSLADLVCKDPNDHIYTINNIIDINYNYNQEGRYEMTTTANINTNLWFARVISDKWRVPFNISATATAITEPGYGPFPIGIYKDVWEDLKIQSRPYLGEGITIKGNGLTIGGELSDKPYISPDLPGWFSLVGPVNNKKDIDDYMEQGMPGCYGINQGLYELEGATNGIKKGLEERINNANSGECAAHPYPGHCPYTPVDHIIKFSDPNYSYNDLFSSPNEPDKVYDKYKICPRLLLIPIVDVAYDIDEDLSIEGFIIAYLDAFEGSDVKFDIRVVYLGELTLDADDACLNNHRYARLIN